MYNDSFMSQAWKYFLLVITCLFFSYEAAQGQLALENDKGFMACGTEGDFLLTVKQASSAEYVSFKIDWGDGGTPEEVGKFSSLEHHYKKAGNYTLRFYGKTSASAAWGMPVEYPVSAEERKIGFLTDGSSVGPVCKGKTMELFITGMGKNSASTVYTVDYGDKSNVETYYGSMDKLVLKHSYNQSSCDAVDNQEGYTVKVTAINGCGTKYEATSGPYPIVEVLKLEMNLPKKECTDYEVDLNAITSVTPPSCGALEIKKAWTINGEAVTNSYQVFDTPGTYTIVATATMAGLDCGNDRVQKVIEIIEKVEAKVTPEQADVCKDEALTLDASGSKGGEKKYSWSVVGGDATKVKFLPNASSEKVQAVFSEYGDYKIRVYVYNGCSDDEAFSEVHVKVDPEVVKKKEIAPMCPERNGNSGLLNMDGSVVGYRWYNNARSLTWTVAGVAGGWSWQGGSNERSEYPQLKFTKPGTYTLTVTVDGADCGATTAQLQKSWVVVVDDPALTPRITVKGGKTEVCEGVETVEFENNSSANQTIQYHWTVYKEGTIAAKGTDYIFTAGNETAGAPAIRFLAYGDYAVTADLEIHCNSAQLSFPFRVKKEPVAVKTGGEIAAVCPEGTGNSGVVDMNGKVAYTWYNDTDRKVEWSVTPSEGVSWVSGYGSNTLFPQLKFSRKGNYTIQLKVPGVGCSAAPAVLSWPVTVYDPQISGDITMSAAMESICEGESVTFKNTIVAVNPFYSWTVTRVEGDRAGDYTMAQGSGGQQPEITFHRYGTYRIQVEVGAQCAGLSRDFTVLVRKDPEIVTFGELGNGCKPAVLNLRGQIAYEWYNDTQKELTWTVDKASGWEFINNTGEHSEFPVFKFTDPGTYKLTVTLDGVGCGGKKLMMSREYTVLDPAVKKDITIEGEGGNNVIICEEQEVAFKNLTASAIPIEYLWTVTSDRPVQAGVDYEFTRGDATSPEPKILFHTYGEYVLEVSLTTECNADQPTTDRFNVTVQRDPEVYLQNPESVCPGDVLNMNEEMVTYLWNNNRKKDVYWSVTTAGGAPAEGVTWGETDLYPQFSFTLPGTYKIAVSLEQPAGCAGNALNAATEVVVHDPAMELEVSPLTKELCEGERFAFTNASTAAEAETYKWTVTPAAGVPADGWQWAAGSADTDKAPGIDFKHYGVYTVRVEMTANHDCDVKWQEMTVTVKKDPSVVLGDFPDRCPGDVLLATEDNYTWRDNVQEVVWQIDAPAGVVIGQPAGLTPTVNFAVPGIYTVTAQLTSHGCPGDHLSDSKTFRIYPPDIQVDVEVARQVEEGGTIKVTNRSVGQINGYTWSVEQADGWEFVAPTGADDAEPEIKFTEYGDYRLKLVIDGECSDSVRYFDVAAKGVPKYTFKEFENRCAGTILKMRDYLTCDPRGATITPLWTITPAGDDEYEYLNPGGAGDLYPEIHFKKKGRYTLVLKANAEFGGEQVMTHEVNVLQNTVTAIVREDLAACTKPSAPLNVELTNSSDGDSLSYAWSVVPETGWTYSAGDAAARQPEIRITERGDYSVTLKISNICAEGQASFDIHAYTNPVIDPIEDIKDVCERGYVFRGSDLVHVDDRGDALKTVKWTATPAGAHWMAPATETTLQPDIEFDGSGTPYRMKLEVSNGCGDIIAETFTVLVDEFKKITPLEDMQLCALVSPVLLQAEPDGGEWSSLPGGMVEKHGDGKYYFNPYKDEDAGFKVVYTYGHKSCRDYDTLDLTVHKLPVVDAGVDRQICVNLPPETLVPVEPPTGGTWQGTGVTGDRFDPAVAREGVHKLEYWFTDPLTLCPNRDSLLMTVHPLPDASFTTPGQHCLSVDSLFTPVQLGVGNHFSWDFNDGTTDISEDKAIAHHYDLPGRYEVVLTATSVNGCVKSSAPVSLEVVNQPLDAAFEVDKIKGCGPLAVKFKVDRDKYNNHPFGYQSYHWVFGNGEVSDELQPHPDSVIFQPPLFDTICQITFQVYNVCNTKTLTKDIKVLSSPAARFVMMPEEGCDPLEVDFANESTGNGNQYSWTFGDGSTSTDREPTHIFRTGKKSTPFYIELVAHNECNTTSFRDTLVVKPNSLSVKFKMSDKFICAGDTVCFTNYSSDTSATILNQYWDFGDGQYSSAWDTCHRFDLPGRLEVSVMLDNGCSKAGYTDTVVVYPIPKPSIECVNPLCEGDAFQLVLQCDQPLKDIAWDLGDGTTANAREVDHVYQSPGFFTPVVRVVSAEIASCPAQASLTVEAWPKPYISILPLDTVACPPFLYRPEIVGEGTNYFRWDYGDGTEITSDMEHLYTNDTNYILEYNIRAYVETNRGCKREYDGQIRIFNGPKAAWDKDISFGRPEKVRFINLSRDYTQSIWYLPDGRIVNSPDDQLLVFEEEDTYPISLAVVNEFGCRDSLYLDYRSYQGGLYFPNTFIPHSTNPKVNHFNGVGMGLKEYRLEILDLYGNKIWETTALSMGMPSEGWDGRNSQGKLMPQGVYIWRAKAVFFSEDVWTGDNNRSGKPQSTQGTVLLLRE